MLKIRSILFLVTGLFMLIYSFEIKYIIYLLFSLILFVFSYGVFKKNMTILLMLLIMLIHPSYIMLKEKGNHYEVEKGDIQDRFEEITRLKVYW